MISTVRIRAAALLAASAAAAIGTSLAAEPVSVRAAPVTETIHGISLTDEYRWMEDPANAAEMLAFIEAENARTRAMLDALPERAWFEQRLAELSSDLGLRLNQIQNASTVTSATPDRKFLASLS